MLRISSVAFYGLGQTPPGEVTIQGGDPLRNRAECDSFDGVLYDGGRLCCLTRSGKSFCRVTTFGVAEPTPTPASAPTLPPLAIPGAAAPTAQQGLSTGATVGIIGGGLALLFLTVMLTR